MYFRRGYNQTVNPPLFPLITNLSSGGGSTPAGGPTPIPVTSIYGEYLYSNGTQFVVGGPNVNIGCNAGKNGSNTNNTSIAIGYYAGQNSQTTNCIALGTNAGQNSQNQNAIAIGTFAGNASQGTLATAIGYYAGEKNQGIGSISVGYFAGNLYQGTAAVAIGYSAGTISQGLLSIAVGNNAGNFNQGTNSISIGYFAGSTFQGSGAISIGKQAGTTTQNFNSIAIGYFAGNVNQGSNAIAIGYNAGNTNQGSFSVCIGTSAQSTYSNSIVFNASNSPLVAQQAGALYVNPINNATSSIGSAYRTLMYDTGTSEVVYSTSTNTDVKTFVIDHPLDDLKYLVHACLEGPEAGVYYRGEAFLQNDFVEIELPDYVSAFATDLTVNATASFDKLMNTYPELIGVTPITNNKFKIFGNGTGKFNWYVYGKRHDINVEPLKQTIVVHGDGPYKWI